jgi:hypothetical protein
MGPGRLFFIPPGFVDGGGKKGQFLLSHTSYNHMGKALGRPPYMGGVKKPKTEQISEFSPEQPIYPQFLATYPQVGRFLIPARLMDDPYIWGLSWTEFVQ